MELPTLDEINKVRVITASEDSKTNFSSLKWSRSKSTKSTKYILVTDIVTEQFPTTNGFRYSQVDFNILPEEPRLLLQSIETNNDSEHEFILLMKSLYYKVVKHLQMEGYSIESSNIIEVIFYDNENEKEFSFEIEIHLKSEIEFDKLIMLEDGVFEKFEEELILNLKDNKVEVIISLYGKED